MKDVVQVEAALTQPVEEVAAALREAGVRDERHRGRPLGAHSPPAGAIHLRPCPRVAPPSPPLLFFPLSGVSGTPPPVWTPLSLWYPPPGALTPLVPSPPPFVGALCFSLSLMAAGLPRVPLRLL